MVLYIAVCDDEMSDLIQERELLESLLPSVSDDVTWEIDTFMSSKDMLNSDKIYDLIFLDVEMDGLNGIITAEMLHKKSSESLIFYVTHHEDYMDRALDNHAFRFWIKPIDETRLAYGIASAIKKIRLNRRSIAVIEEKKPVNVFFKDIIYVYHSNRFTYVVTTTGTIETRDTFKSIIKQLMDDCFVETHASCCVNLNYVVDYDKTSIVCEYKGKIYKPYISTRKYAAFNKKFKEWCGELL